MGRHAGVLPGGARLGDLVNLGVVAKTFPVDRVREVLLRTGKQSKRERRLPADVMVYYVVALGFFAQVSCREALRLLLEGLEKLRLGGRKIPVAGKSAITQARERLGVEPLRKLHDELVRPIGTPRTKGSYYRRWRLVSLDASTIDVADSVENEKAFGRAAASRGSTAFAQMRFASLVENGTHVLFGTHTGSYSTDETTLAKEVVKRLEPGMLCLADRGFLGYELWKQSMDTGAELLWRVKRNTRFDPIEVLGDGSYLARIYPSSKHRNRDEGGIVVRLVEYELDGAKDAEPLYRLATTILDAEAAPACELALLYHERWEIETVLDELKNHLLGPNVVLRSRKPELVEQEFYGLLLAHFAVRGLMHEAALYGELDPDELSYLHSVRVVRRKLPDFVAFPPSLARGAACGRA